MGKHILHLQPPCSVMLLATLLLPTSFLPRLAVDTIWAARRLAGLQKKPLELGVDVEVRASPGKGKGVYALRDLPAETCLSRYTGAVHADSTFDRIMEAGKTSGDYALQLADGPF